MIKFGICFSREFEGNTPLSHIGKKTPVYLKLLELCRKQGWEIYVLTRKTYKGEGTFIGSWKFEESGFIKIFDPVKIDLVYDRTGGVKFPPEEDSTAIFVNNRQFKLLCWNKLEAYKEIGQFMPKTYDLEDKNKLDKILSKIKTDWVVLKPFNGLKGIGVYVGPKNEAKKFEFDKKYSKYIVQEFVDTKKGIEGLIEGYHDLRVAVVNNKIVLSHIRTPKKGTFKANVAAGGSLIEIPISKIPENVIKIVSGIKEKFYEKYGNPSYSIDFGIDNGKPYIFEINDQIGFPLWEMKNREFFLEELVNSFHQKTRL